MATDTLSRVTKQTFHRASPDRLGEEPFRSPRQRPRTSVTCPEANRAAHCKPIRAVRSSSFSEGARRVEVRSVSWLARQDHTSSCTHSRTACLRACVMPTRPPTRRCWHSGHFGNDCRLLASNLQVDAAQRARTNLATCMLSDGKNAPQVVDFSPFTGLWWGVFALKRHFVFECPRNANCFIFNKPFGSFRLNSIFSSFSSHFQPSAVRYRSSFIRSVAPFSMGQLL